MKIWSATSGRLLTTLRAGKYLEMASWSPDGSRVFTNNTCPDSGECTRSTIGLWDACTGRRLLSSPGEVPHRQPFSPDGRFLAYVGLDSALRMWDVRSHRRLYRISGHLARSVAWSPDSRRLATLATDGSVIITDAATGRPLHRFAGRYLRRRMAWSPDGKRFAAMSWDRRLSVWDVGSGRRLLTLPSNGRRRAWFGWHPTGQRVVTGDDNHTVDLWDIARQRRLAAFDADSGIVIGGGCVHAATPATFAKYFRFTVGGRSLPATTPRFRSCRDPRALVHLLRHGRLPRRLDRDQDGVADPIDACPRRAGPPSHSGCPQHP